MKFYLNIITIIIGMLITPLAFSYIGPGAGISAVGSAIAFIGIIFLLFVGFLWYPVKTLLGRKNPKVTLEESSKEDDETSDEAKGL